jgi:hypothetical protein
VDNTSAISAKFQFTCLELSDRLGQIECHCAALGEGIKPRGPNSLPKRAT